MRSPMFLLFVWLNQVERSVSTLSIGRGRSPPDLRSLLLHGRIVYIGVLVSRSIWPDILREQREHTCLHLKLLLEANSFKKWANCLRNVLGAVPAITNDLILESWSYWLWDNESENGSKQGYVGFRYVYEVDDEGDYQYVTNTILGAF